MSARSVTLIDVAPRLPGVGALVRLLAGGIPAQFGDVAQLVRALPSQQIRINFKHLERLLSDLLSVLQ